MALTEGVTMTTSMPMAEKRTSSHHEIKMEDIKTTFKEDFADEIHDANKYCDMAKAAEMMGHMDLARGLYAMSHDEYTHAEFIHDCLVDWGCEISEKELMEWHELKERVHRSFR